MSYRGEIRYNVPMALKYDLHSHTTASDGTLNPGELVHRAQRLGVDVLAVTDHDTTEGLSSARAAAEVSGLILVPGVEISVSWEGHVVHVLGLNIDAENRELQKGLTRLRRFRAWRATPPTDCARRTPPNAWPVRERT